MEGACVRDTSDPLEGACVDNVQHAGLRTDADKDPPAVLSNRYSVGAAAEGHLFDNLSGLSIHNVEHVLRLNANINSTSVGREADIMGQLNVFDHLHDLVRSTVDDINRVSPVVRNIDTECPRRQWERHQEQSKQKPHLT